ncbi:MAG: Peptide deformylase [Candidatus Amesbacteria bacterium GW2011_GWA2_42_12]|uniref:Peptide deformylase n=1 Tax=Candidatus Amesbacteria bacterium GW2011_GWA2_42_12 TaxID=1618356 RepID=A0A0G1B627_9BACT|nr:MAG: Peptide deformylase [Candidatus Amesbacteria bacterium GW2011_GWA2_42_12]
MSKIVVVPSQVLRKIAELVKVVDSRVLQVLKDMNTALVEAKSPEGVGLAAPQIGVSLRIFMIRPVSKGPITIFINPEILKFSQRKTHPTGKKGVFEGCLSIPGHYSPIKRSTSVTVKYQSINQPIPNTTNHRDLSFDIERFKLIEKTAVFSGFPAHVIQHEMDHLNGILFIDRVLEQSVKLYKEDSGEWEEVGI